MMADIIRQGSGTVYSGKPDSVFVITAIIIIIHIVIVILIRDKIDAAFWVVNVIVFCLYMLMAYVMYFQATQIKFIIYDDGLDWQRGGSHTFTIWDNLKHIGSKTEGDATSYGIHLHNEVQPETHTWIAQRLFAAPIDYIRLIPTVTVPMQWSGIKQGSVIDMAAFAETEFGQDLLHHAPHVFEITQSE